VRAGRPDESTSGARAPRRRNREQVVERALPLFEQAYAQLPPELAPRAADHLRRLRWLRLHRRAIDAGLMRGALIDALVCLHRLSQAMPGSPEPARGGTRVHVQP
jgi:hypothetical protein